MKKNFLSILLLLGVVGYPGPADGAERERPGAGRRLHRLHVESGRVREARQGTGRPVQVPLGNTSKHFPLSLAVN